MVVPGNVSGDGASPPASNSDAGAGDKEDGDASWTTVKRKRGRDACVVPDGSNIVGFVSPKLLESHETCRRYQNRLALMGCQQYSLDFNVQSGLIAGIGTVQRSTDVGPTETVSL